MNDPRYAGHDHCDVCLHFPATHLAHHTGNGDTWQVCGRCRDQAIRYKSPIVHRALAPQAEAS